MERAEDGAGVDGWGEKHKAMCQNLMLATGGKWINEDDADVDKLTRDLRENWGQGEEEKLLLNCLMRQVFYQQSLELAGCNSEKKMRLKH